MSKTTNESSAPAAAEHEWLINQTVERSLVLQQVMRRVMEQLRTELSSASALPINGAPSSAQPFGGVLEAQYRVLHVLAEAGSLAVGEIAERCHVAVPTISKMLGHLEGHGLIERHVDRSNRRVVRVVLTEAGRARHAQAAQRFQAAFARVLGPLTNDELKDLVAAFGHLQRLVAAGDSFVPNGLPREGK